MEMVQPPETPPIELTEAGGEPTGGAVAPVLNARTPPRLVAASLGPFDDARGQLALCAALFGLFAIMGLLSPGTFTDDDLTRFFSARVAFEFPEKFLGLWTRPAFMVLYALPAQLGFWAVELTTALVSAATCLFVMRISRRQGDSYPALAAVFTAFQPWFLLLSFSALTEPLAALLIAMSLDLMSARRFKASAVVAALIPLARLELSLVLGIWALFYVSRRAWGAVLLLPLGVLLWDVLGWLTSGDPLYLFHQVFVERERGLEAPGGWHYLRGLIHVAGPSVFFFAVLGLFESVKKRRDTLVWGSLLVMLMYYSWSATKAGSLQSAGYLRHLVSLAPFLAILGLRGFQAWLLDQPTLTRTGLLIGVPLLTWLYLSGALVNRYLIGGTREYLGASVVTVLALVGLMPWFARPRLARRGVQRLVVALVFLASAGFFFAKHGPIRLSNEQQVMRDAADWYGEHELQDRIVLCNHSAFHHFIGGNPFQEERYPRLNRQTLDQAPISSVVLWEGHYAHALAGGVDLEELESDPNYRVRHRFLGPQGLYFAVLFEKVGAAGEQPDELTESAYRHRGLGFSWKLAEESPWQFQRERGYQKLLRATRRGPGPAASSTASDPSFEVSFQRFFRDREDTYTFGQRLVSALTRTSNLIVRDSRLTDDGVWLWIAGHRFGEDVLVGVTVSGETCTALKIVASGPSGSLRDLEAEIPALAAGIRFDEID